MPPLFHCSISTLPLLLEKNVDVNVTISSSGDSYLHYLVRKLDSNFEHIKLVIGAVKDLNRKNAANLEPLHLVIQIYQDAAANNWRRDYLEKISKVVSEVIRLMKQHKCSFVTQPWLLLSNYIPLSTWLLECGADPLVVDGKGNTVVHNYFTEMQNRHYSDSQELLQAFLERGVNSLAVNSEGATAIENAEGFLPEYSMLVNHGKCTTDVANRLFLKFLLCDENGRQNSEKDDFLLWLMKQTDKLYADDKGCNFLHIWILGSDRCSNTSTTLLHQTIRAGVDVDKQDVFGRTPLHYAVMKAVSAPARDKMKYVDLIGVLVKDGANIEIKDFSTDGSTGKTAVEYLLQFSGSRPSRNAVRMETSIENDEEIDGEEHSNLEDDAEEDEFEEVDSFAALNLRPR